MGWQIGYDSRWQRDIGYGVPAICDRPRCGEKIDRGLEYVCGGEPYGGERGCGLYFCGDHLTGSRRLVRPFAAEPPRYVRVCGRCDKGRPPYEPTPDVREWLEWKLADESWGPWRDGNAEAVAAIRAALAAA